MNSGRARTPNQLFTGREVSARFAVDSGTWLNCRPSGTFLLCISIFALTLAQPLSAAEGESKPSETTVRFDAAARDFTESSPMGNGRLGAMMFGGVDEERIVLNESSVWSGSRQDSDRPAAYKELPEIRRLLLDGKNPEAEAVVNSNFTCKGAGSQSGQYGCYQVLGNLHLKFLSNGTNAPATDYHRELNLSDATTRMSFNRGGVEFTREMFVSAPDQVIVGRFDANQPGRLSFEARLDRPEHFQTVADGNKGLLMTGQLDNGVDGKGVRYATRVRLLNRGGEVSIRGDVLSVRQADQVILLITAATDYQGFAGRHTKNPEALSFEDMKLVSAKSYGSMRRAHIADYRKFFKRVALHLGPDDLTAFRKSTPERVKAFSDNAQDPGLAALYFNFGRYLLISSSRPGGFPANLQGIWAAETSTPWAGDWHLDINAQMNYWPAEAGNLSELTQPLFALIDSLQEPGTKTARDYYAARGWVVHVITNPWGFTSPGESASWGASTGGSAWVCQHLYDHYLFTLDRKFLQWAYPIMKGSARFYADLLMEDPKHHWLVIIPAYSQENHFRMADGKESASSVGTTVDAQMLRYLFEACIQSSKILGIDEEFRKELSEKRAHLMPTPVGSDGRIMEWPEEYVEADMHHRHIAHLWGLYPGDEISPYTTPELAKAARKTLEVRGDDGVGWSLAYKAVLWARLGDGNRAWAFLRRALNLVVTHEIRYDGGGGVYPNLFDASPPFQIDGNFGAVAAIEEMLVQSQNGSIQLLPALPDDWQDGQVSGLRARGGFEVSMKWHHGRLTEATIRSESNEPCHISYKGMTAELKIKKGKSITLNGLLK